MYLYEDVSLNYFNPETRKLTCSNEQVWIWNFRKDFINIVELIYRMYCVKKGGWKNICIFGNIHFKYICMKKRDNENLAQLNIDAICRWQMEIKVNKFLVQWPHLVDANRRRTTIFFFKHFRPKQGNVSKCQTSLRLWGSFLACAFFWRDAVLIVKHNDFLLSVTSK